MDELQKNKIKKYYRFQSKFYNITRPFILYGRRKLLKIILNQIHKSQYSKYKIQNILDIACGTGFFINHINKKHPEINITGIDMSEEMLLKINMNKSLNKKINLINSDFLEFNFGQIKFDVIILSYILTISGNDPEQILLKAKSLLNEGGIVAIVDFHKIFNFYRKFMSKNNITCQDNIEEILNNNFTGKYFSKRLALPLPWSYFIFIE